MVQTLQSQIQESVENEETYNETQRSSLAWVKTSLRPGFGAPDPSTGAEAPSEEIIPMSIWPPFEDKPIDECIANYKTAQACCSLYNYFTQLWL